MTTFMVYLNRNVADWISESPSRWLHFSGQQLAPQSGQRMKDHSVRCLLHLMIVNHLWELFMFGARLQRLLLFLKCRIPLSITLFCWYPHLAPAQHHRHVMEEKKSQGSDWCWGSALTINTLLLDSGWASAKERFTPGASCQFIAGTERHCIGAHILEFPVVVGRWEEVGEPGENCVQCIQLQYSVAYSPIVHCMPLNGSPLCFTACEDSTQKGWRLKLQPSSVTWQSRLINQASTICGSWQTLLSDLYNCSVIRKATMITTDSSHPLHQSFQRLPSGRRYKVPLAWKNPSLLIPSAVTILKTLKWNILVFNMHFFLYLYNYSFYRETHLD